jgi:hypothetical protein
VPAFLRGPQQAPLLRLLGRKARVATRKPGSPSNPDFGLLGWEETAPLLHRVSQTSFSQLKVFNETKGYHWSRAAR